MNENKKVTELTEDDIGKWVIYDNGFDTERGRIKSFNNEIGIAFVVYKANGNWDLDHWKDYTAQATKYLDLFFID